MNEAAEMLQDIVDKVDAYHKGFDEGVESGREEVGRAITASLCIGCGIGVILTVMVGPLLIGWLTP